MKRIIALLLASLLLTSCTTYYWVQETNYITNKNVGEGESFVNTLK